MRILNSEEGRDKVTGKKKKKEEKKGRTREKEHESELSCARIVVFSEVIRGFLGCVGPSFWGEIGTRELLWAVLKSKVTAIREAKRSM